ncbi:hypothetical protein MPC1_6490003 [Methylocella tundrae]|nr:hypothetical protein MPC1_6490003 [Methylocella tundrae]
MTFNTSRFSIMGSHRASFQRSLFDIFEIGCVNARISEDVLERALRNDFAGVHHHHAVGDCFQKLDAVFDDDNCNLHFLGEKADQVIDLVDFRIDQPGGWLIHQEEGRAAHQQTGEEKLAAVQRFELRRWLVVAYAQADKFGAIFGVEASEIWLIGLTRRFERLADGEFVWHDRRLVGAPYAKPRACVQRQARDVLALEQNLAALWLDTAGQHFKQAGLAGSVRAYDAEHFTTAHVEADAVKNLPPAEIEMDVPACKKRGARVACAR